MKRLFVRLFCRFKVARAENGDYMIMFKLPFLDWKIMAEEFYVLRKMALRRIEELRLDGGDLLYTYKEK